MILDSTVILEFTLFIIFIPSKICIMSRYYFFTVLKPQLIIFKNKSYNYSTRKNTRKNFILSEKQRNLRTFQQDNN